MGGKSGTLEERFWRKVQKRAPDECWIFPSTKRYGYMYVGKTAIPQHRPAHQIAYILSVGPITGGLHVLHRCDNHHCVNPAHLYLGTHQDNMLDRKERKRSYRSIGEANRAAKLTTEQILEMRALYASGMNFSELGRRFGTAKSTARRNCLGMSWKHLSIAPAERTKVKP